MQSFRVSIIGFFFFWTLSLNAQIPEYYSQLDLSEKDKPLLLQLANLTIDNHLTFIPYTSSSTDTWDILRISDLSNQVSDNVLLIYGYDDNDGDFNSDRTRNAFDSCHSSSCTGLWTREHVFAKSLANPSLSYEPVITSTEDSSGLDYEIKDGILKELVSGMTDSSDKSNNTSVIIDGEKFDLPINKISLGNINEPEDDEIFHYCIENNCIALGFGEDIDFSEVNDRKDIRDMYRSNGIEFNTSMAFEISAIERLVLWMKEGQLVLIPNGNKKLRAIGVISGEYYCDPSTPIRYSQFRKVNWLYTDLDIPIKQIYGKNFSQQTIYVMNKDRFDKSYFSGGAINSNASKNHVLIIDEINREITQESETDDFKWKNIWGNK